MKSISFNEETLKAILDGRKTRTRRPHIQAKYQVGDIVYVKEPWQIIGWSEDVEFWIKYLADNKKALMEIPHEINASGEIEQIYLSESIDDIEAAGYGLNEDTNCYEYPEDNCPTRVRIEMPEYASPIKLKITDVRKEKLQDITEQDAIAEGFNTKAAFISPLGKPFVLHWFENIWWSIYRKDKSKSWEANPWVWVYEFERITL